MSFEKEFPELIAFKQHYMADIIQKHCLSKQRVLEAIDGQRLKDPDPTNDFHTYHEQLIDEILKELEL